MRDGIKYDGVKTQFKKGQSGNPAGKPKGIPNTATRMQRFLSLKMKGKNPVSKEDEEFTVAELIDLQVIAKAMRGDISAWDKIMDRLEGKPKQHLDHTSNGEAINPLDALPAKEQADIIRKINKANDRRADDQPHNPDEG